MQRILILGSFLFTLGSGPVLAGEPKPEPSPAETTLRDAGIATDGPGLLKYLRAQTPGAADLARLQEAAAKLGHRAFSVRERATKTLREGGRSSLGMLRPLLASPDLEVSRRSRRVIDDIERVPYSALMSVVVQVIAERRPEGAAPALFAYLPFVNDEQVEEAVRESLAVVALEKGVPLPIVQAALSEKEARKRAAAAFVLGRAKAPPVKALTALLKDGSYPVRLQAAAALIRAREKAGVTAIIGLIDDGPLEVGRQAEDVLYTLAGEKSPSVSLGVGDEASRKRCRTAWQGWWKKYGDSVDLARIKSAGVKLGITLVCLYDSPSSQGKVVALGPDGKVRWQFGELGGPNDARLLPNGRVLVAERNSSRVTERDTTGRIVWEKRVEGSAIAAHRLPGGNTLITTWNQILEVRADGKVAWTHSEPGGMRYATLARSGRILAINAAGQVLELDRAGKVLRTITPAQYANGAGYWASVEQVSSGHYLLALGTSRRVIEIDDAGKVLWETEVPNVVFATRESNGHTLVCDFEGCQLLELDRSGKEVNRRKVEGRPFVVRQY
jgi:hypothetical protein